MKMYVVDLGSALFDERTIMLANISAFANFSDDSLFDESDEIERRHKLVRRKLPRRLHVTLWYYEKMSGHFARITKEHIGMLVFF